MNDAEIIGLCQSGQKDAFEILFERYKLPAWRLAFTITGNSSMADDVVQEAFIKAWRAISNVKRETSFGPWFYAIVVNQSKRQIKRHHLWRWLPLSDTVVNNGSFNIISTVENKNVVWEAVKKLPVHLRTVVALRYVLDWNEENISLALKIPTGTVKSRLYRARQILKKELAMKTLGGKEDTLSWTTSMK
ncbi:MAG: RNA polymerase sigma factor [Bacillota bacterium]